MATASGAATPAEAWYDEGKWKWIPKFGFLAQGKQWLLSDNDEEGGEQQLYQNYQYPFQTLDSHTATTIATYFLMDYEAGRPPTLSPNFRNITDYHLKMYRIQFSWQWRIFGRFLTAFLLFVWHTHGRLSTALLHTYAVILFSLDVYMKNQVFDKECAVDRKNTERFLMVPLLFFLLLLGTQSWAWFMLASQDVAFSTLISSLFKPLVLFYMSAKARDALRALSSIAKVLVRVLIIEVFLILTFAAVACRMFYSDNNFRNLAVSWLSLFKLSNSVVNPSIWMPMYAKSRANAFFFIFFVITSVYYMHSLVLSVVFQTYIHAAKKVHERSATDREDTVRLAYLALAAGQTNFDPSTDVVSKSSIRETLSMIRPHYNEMKLNALMDIVDPTNQQQTVDFVTFRTKIRQALDASVRTTRRTTVVAYTAELFSSIVTITNFLYVILLTSEFQEDWFKNSAVVVGTLITFVSLFELVVRINPMNAFPFNPVTRLNGTFDGLALLGVLVSCFGIVWYLFGHAAGVEYILTGRAIDMIRIMRFFPMFRDVVERSTRVLPALAGPGILVLTTIHVFVYFGMALWRGAIDVDELSQNEYIMQYYYLNNFNSYTRGLVTIFNIMVVNDWHEIARVFLYADRCSSPFIVYPFFISVLFIGVSIMLNVVTAFFVETFVKKLSSSDQDGEGPSAFDKKKDFSIQTVEKARVRILSPAASNSSITEANGRDSCELRASVSSDHSAEVFEFDVYERDGFDQIMKAVGGGSDQEQEAVARKICDCLECFGSLSPGWENVGYMVCTQQSTNRFGNRRFHTMAQDYVRGEALHKTVSEMHSELLLLVSGNRGLVNTARTVRYFANELDSSKTLEIEAKLIPNHKMISLFVAKIRDLNAPAS